MRRIMNKSRLLALLMLLTVAFGCQRRPLEVLIGTTVRVIVKVQWDVLIDTYAAADPELAKPTGVSLYIFRDNDFYRKITTASVDEIEVQLEQGNYKMYMIGYSPDEYWRQEFFNMEDYDKAYARLQENTLATWARKSDDETVVENPEVMYAGVADPFEITEQMTEDYQYYYTHLTKLRKASQNNTKGNSSTKSADEVYYEERVEQYTIHVPIVAYNTVSQFMVSIYASNADLLQALRASTSGMARGLVITSDVTNDETGIQMIREGWKLVMDDEEKNIGHLDATITSFGLPGGAAPSPDRDPSLNVSALMVDGSTIANYTFQVGDLIQLLDPNPGYKHLYKLVLGSVKEPAMDLPIVKEETSGGFSAGVEDWGEEVNVDLNI